MNNIAIDTERSFGDRADWPYCVVMANDELRGFARSPVGGSCENVARAIRPARFARLVTDFSERKPQHAARVVMRLGLCRRGLGFHELPHQVDQPGLLPLDVIENHCRVGAAHVTTSS